MRILQRIKDLLHQIKNLYLRFRYGAGCCDIFCLNYHLAKRIIKPLKFFRANVYSFPTEFKKIEEWESIIDEMIFAFEFFLEDEYANPKYENYNAKQMEKVYDRAQKGFELFGKYYRDLWL